MQQGRFAERELFYNVRKRQHVCWPAFAELHERSLDLRRVERCRRLLPNPGILSHRAKHHAIFMERLVTTMEAGPEPVAPSSGSENQPDSCRPARHRVPRERPARWLCAGAASENIRLRERGYQS